MLEPQNNNARFHSTAVWRWLLLGLCALCLLGVGCRAPGQSKSPSREEEKMLAKLSIARSHHQLASIASRRGKADQALKELNSILKLRFPKGFRPGEEMLLDAWARKANFLLRQKRPKQALQTIDQAIKRPTWLKRSYYIAHLFQVRGTILEALSKPVEAVRSYQESIRRNQAVIHEIDGQQSKRSP